MTEFTTVDGNEAVARVAYQISDVIAIYPITPSSNMGEACDEWSSRQQPNIWGNVPLVQEMQSEAGAAGAVHGALQAGSLCTTFTASQGLLLMIPNMFKIAGELVPAVFHISARAIATQGLSIFGDHSDVMACRSTGWGMLFGGSPQEAQDMAMIAHCASLKSRVPFLNIFDGFRTSHEVQRITAITEKEILELLPQDCIADHRNRSLSPDRPVIRGTAQNPDVYFQGRETVNPFYLRAPDVVSETMEQFAAVTGRTYQLFDYFGDPNAEQVMILMGSGAEAAEETVERLGSENRKVGVLKVRLYRPFSAEHLVAALPTTVKRIAVLDRTKEPGGMGEPLYLDVVAALAEKWTGEKPLVIGGRYGLGSKEFTPGMVKAVFDNLDQPEPKNHFTIGINDDSAQTSLEFDPSYSIDSDGTFEGVFWGLGADGTVGANKNSIKIIGEETDNWAQGYFVYDSKKSGSVTVSHLRFGKKRIKSTYLVQKANFVAIHQFMLMFRYPVLANAAPGATVLLNSPFGPEDVWQELPKYFQETVIEKKLKLYVLDGYKVASATGMGVRINTIMQTAFFALCGILPREEAIEKIRETIRKTYGKRGPRVVEQNFAAVDQSLATLFEVEVQADAKSTKGIKPPVPSDSPQFVKSVIGEIISGRGDLLPVSLMPVDGTFPTGTTQYEKRGISLETPAWEPELCSQCGKCVMACPHSVIRAKIVKQEELNGAPPGFKSALPKFRDSDGLAYVLAISDEDCTGCALCAEVCPEMDKTDVRRKAINMEPHAELPEEQKAHWASFLELSDEPALAERPIYDNPKSVQFLQPMFEFSGACAGCGETPYLKLLSQLFGDRLIIANATGCSSIYSGNLPTTPWCKNKAGRGPAWANSLFEDNAEFGFGMRLALDTQRLQAQEAIAKYRGEIGEELADALLGPLKTDPESVEVRRAQVSSLKVKLSQSSEPDMKRLLTLADSLVDRSIWIVGGDGWAYDIGYGGLDHVIAQGRKVRLLVLDTEVYSNTGGQASKSTPRAAVAKFASGGKRSAKKDLGRMAMGYGHVYVAEVALGADESQTIKAFLEANAHDGPAIIIAYSHCIAHAIDMTKGYEQQKLAVETGHWPLYRFNPARALRGRNPMQLDSSAPSRPFRDYAEREGRYRILMQSDPGTADRLLEEAQADVDKRWSAYEKPAAKEVKS